MNTVIIILEVLVCILSFWLVRLYWSYYKSLEYYSKIFQSVDIIKTLKILYKDELENESYILNESKNWDKTDYGKNGFEEKTILRMNLEVIKSFKSKRNIVGLVYLIILIFTFYFKISLTLYILPLFTILYFIKPLKVVENMVTNYWLEIIRLLINFKNKDEIKFRMFCESNSRFYIFKDLI
jgi:hypothetical protein